MKVGSGVKVVKMADEVGDPKYIGRVGIVSKMERGTAGVGDSENDPYITVDFGDGSSDGFWTEELELVEG